MVGARLRTLGAALVAASTLLAASASAESVKVGVREGYYDNGDTDPAASFLAGIGFRTGSVIPYSQAKLIAKSDTEFAVAFGVRF